MAASPPPPTTQFPMVQDIDTVLEDKIKVDNQISSPNTITQQFNTFTNIAEKYVGNYFEILKEIGTTSTPQIDLIEMADGDFKSANFSGTFNGATISKTAGQSHNEFILSLGPNQNNNLVIPPNLNVNKIQNNRPYIQSVYLVAKKMKQFVDLVNHVETSKVDMYKYRYTLLKSFYIMTFIKDQIAKKNAMEKNIDETLRNLISSNVLKQNPGIQGLINTLNQNQKFRDKIDEHFNVLVGIINDISSDQVSMLPSTTATTVGSTLGQLSTAVTNLVDNRIKLSDMNIVVYQADAMEALSDMADGPTKQRVKEKLKGRILSALDNIVESGHDSNIYLMNNNPTVLPASGGGYYNNIKKVYITTGLEPEKIVKKVFGKAFNVSSKNVIVNKHYIGGAADAAAIETNLKTGDLKTKIVLAVKKSLPNGDVDIQRQLDIKKILQEAINEIPSSTPPDPKLEEFKTKIAGTSFTVNILGEGKKLDTPKNVSATLYPEVSNKSDALKNVLQIMGSGTGTPNQYLFQIDNATTPIIKTMIEADTDSDIKRIMLAIWDKATNEQEFKRKLIEFINETNEANSIRIFNELLTSMSSITGGGMHMPSTNLGIIIGGYTQDQLQALLTKARQTNTALPNLSLTAPVEKPILKYLDKKSKSVAPVTKAEPTLAVSTDGPPSVPTDAPAVPTDAPPVVPSIIQSSVAPEEISEEEKLKQQKIQQLTGEVNKLREKISTLRQQKVGEIEQILTTIDSTLEFINGDEKLKSYLRIVDQYTNMNNLMVSFKDKAGADQVKADTIQTEIDKFSQFVKGKGIIVNEDLAKSVDWLKVEKSRLESLKGKYSQVLDSSVHNIDALQKEKTVLETTLTEINKEVKSQEYEANLKNITDLQSTIK